jgi:hypothetical protein
METFFIRHTWKMNISEETREALHENGRIAIHNPVFRDKGRLERDNESLNPDDHDKSGKRRLRTLLRLSTDGGYVCAEFYGKEGWLIGKVEPGTEIEIVRGRWRDFPEREAVMMTLQLVQWRSMKVGASAPMLVARPRQGTAMRWPKAGRSIMRLVEGIIEPPTFDDLSATQQEVLCAEFLRSPIASEWGLPTLAHLVVPTGGTMRDVDISGIADDGQRIVCQVKHSPLRHLNSAKKTLSMYSPASVALLFCDAECRETKNGVTVVPIREVFDAFCSTRLGQRWLTVATSDSS